MNKRYAAIALATALFATQSAADDWGDLITDNHQSPHRPVLASTSHRSDSYTDYARVVSATPIYETVEVAYPEEQCWDERVVHHRRARHSPVGTIAGGIVGGVIGNQFGRGRGKAAMTVAGTLLGAAIGHEASHRPGGRRYVTSERRCELVDRYTTEERLLGYRVEYRYKGETFVTRTDEHPGRRIPIVVSVEPARHL